MNRLRRGMTFEYGHRGYREGVGEGIAGLLGGVLKKVTIRSKAEQGLIWDFYKPRRTHSWNMLVLSWRTLEFYEFNEKLETGFQVEYHWENFILRLWLYRTTIMTLTKLPIVEAEALAAVKRFDAQFSQNGKNKLKAVRDMIEHFDDYASGKGRGPGQRETDLDPWRYIDKDRFEKGQFQLDRKLSYDAAIQLLEESKAVSDRFIEWFKSDLQ